MRQLYLQIYLTFVGILIALAVLAALFWWLQPPSAEDRRLLQASGELLGRLLPGPERPAAELQAALERLGRDFPVDLAVRAGDGALLAATGADPPRADPRWQSSRWVRGRGGALSMALRLPDGRWLIARHHRSRHGLLGLLTIALIAAVIAVGAYPLVRRITGRLERLRARVEALGAGDLATRVEVEGNDEVAALARSFNRAAEQIERLVGAQRALLANASHELRSPLARLRVAIELMTEAPRPELAAQIHTDIAELDELIGELLLASRLDSPQPLERVEPVDLLALVAEEAAHYDAAVSGAAVQIRGDARMLRRLVRNLLENARRHGGGSPIEAAVEAHDRDGARLRVCDRGPGVPEAEREKVFEPFYRPAGSKESGAGLGLALVRQIARRHGGDARCRRRQGGGGCFEVDLRGA